MQRISKLLLSIVALSIVPLWAGFVKPAPVPVLQVRKPEVPIVYHPDYNISFWGIEKWHPFDSKKYGKVCDALKSELGLWDGQFHTPEQEVSREVLLQVHSESYLESLKKSSVVAEGVGIYPLFFVPNFCLQKYLLRPMRLATQGTLDAVDLAIKHGWAINLSGGYHHAKANNAEGFCIYADIPLAVKKACGEYGIEKCMIIDLDAHQGNGHEEILGESSQVDIFDIYNGSPGFYPSDSYAAQFITYNHPVAHYTNDEEYLSILKTELPKAFEQTKPDFIIYNAGTDIYECDPLGSLSVSRVGIIERDEFVFNLAKEHNIPIIMVLSGGYTQESAGIISDSIINLANKKIINIEKE